MKLVLSKLLKIIVGLVVLIVLMVGVGKKQSELRTPEFVFSYAENQSKDYPTTLGGYRFSELVEERTEGRIKIIVYAEGELGYEKEVIEQLQFGGIDFARVSLSEVSEVVAELRVLQMPYLYRDSQHMWQVLDGEIGDEFLNATEGFGLVALSWYDAGARNFYNSVRPINTLEDIKGLKIRVQESKLMADIVEALGAVPVPGTYDEVYSALERGIIAGAENNWPSYESTGHYEVAKYYTVDEHTRVPEVQLCSQVTWDQLSREDQEIIRLCAQESALYERELWGEREKNSAEKASKKGVQVVMMNPEEKIRFQAAVVGVYEKYCEDYMEIIDAIIAKGNE